RGQPMTDTTPLSPFTLSASRLNPGVGKRVRESGQSERCGLISGIVEHGSKGKFSIRWYGVFRYQCADGTLGKATTVYLPGVVGRDLLSQGCPIIAKGDPKPRPFRTKLSLEIWCEADPPDAARPSPLGYTYAVYDRDPAPRPPIDHLVPPELRHLFPPKR